MNHRLIYFFGTKIGKFFQGVLDEFLDFLDFLCFLEPSKVFFELGLLLSDELHEFVIDGFNSCFDVFEVLVPVLQLLLQKLVNLLLFQLEAVEIVALGDRQKATLVLVCELIANEHVFESVGRIVNSFELIFNTLDQLASFVPLLCSAVDLRLWKVLHFVEKAVLVLFAIFKQVSFDSF